MKREKKRHGEIKRHLKVTVPFRRTCLLSVCSGKEGLGQMARGQWVLPALVVGPHVDNLGGNEKTAQ